MKQHIQSDRTFGELTFLEESLHPKNGKRKMWRCACSCGNVTVARKDNILAGKTRSCGCMEQKYGRKHGLAHQVPEYSVWISMRRRCCSDKVPEFIYYGARGIKVCDRWLSFANFYSDMGPRPSRKHSIERINNDGDYEPSNCKWATRLEQARNRRPAGTVKQTRKSNSQNSLAAAPAI